MKRIATALTLLVTLSASAQTLDLIKMSAAKNNDMGLSYYLPKTAIYVDIELTKTTTKAAPYSRYAERFLGITDVANQDQTIYTMDKVSLAAYPEVDKSEGYLMQFKSATTPFIYLTPEGVICSVNETPKSEEFAQAQPKPVSQPLVITPFASSNSNILSEEFHLSGSTAKMAEIVAKQIYRLRESRQDFLTGQADNMPTDGEALKFLLSQLEEQERVLLSQFVGNQQVEKVYQRVKVDPSDLLNSQIIFRFSKYFGVVDKDDLSGAPIFLDMNITDQKSLELADPKEKKKEQPAIYYNIPGKASISLRTADRTLVSGEFLITQFGVKGMLPSVLFENKKSTTRVIFDAQSGAIRQLLQ
ncbi:MAG: DUF4831 family protein [Bacteroidales bacterium]